MSKMLFSEFVNINPAVSIPKGELVSCVMMEELEPGRRYVYPRIMKPYKGGARFEHGDTLFARITPCLENGKIAQYKSNDRMPAFGSSEFFILRAKEGISDPGFVYYLSTTDVIRKPAEKSMFGVSGRQRADVKSIASIKLDFPDISIQRRIASILSAYDDLIENNTRRIKILEEMAKLIYREWFVEFKALGVKLRNATADEKKVTGKDQFPKGWEIKILGEIARLTMGQSPDSKYYNEEGIGLPFHQGVTNFGERFPTDKIYCSIESRVAERDDILMSVRAPVGRLNISNKKIIVGRGLCAIKSNTEHQEYLFQTLKNHFVEEDIMGGGTIFKSVTKDDVVGIKILKPNRQILEKFREIARPMFKELEILSYKNQNLRSTRDLLLPKLVSGEIEV